MGFSSSDPSINAPAHGCVAIVPNDSLDLPKPIRAITIGGLGGTIRFTLNDVVYDTNYLPPGPHAFFAHRIHATGTTATQMTGWY